MLIYHTYIRLWDHLFVPLFSKNHEQHLSFRGSKISMLSSQFLNQFGKEKDIFTMCHFLSFQNVNTSEI